MNIKGRKEYGGTHGNFKAWIPSTKVHVFVTLFQEIIDKSGTREKAKLVTGLNNIAINWLMKEGRLTVRTASIILKAHQSYCK